MTSIQINGWERDAQDYNGKEQGEVFYIVVDGKERAVSKADLIRTIKINLPQRGEEEREQAPTPLFDRNGGTS